MDSTPKHGGVDRNSKKWSGKIQFVDRDLKDACTVFLPTGDLVQNGYKNVGEKMRGLNILDIILYCCTIV